MSADAAPAPAPDALDCYDRCTSERVAAGEAREMAEDECMQDCNEGE